MSMEKYIYNELTLEISIYTKICLKLTFPKSEIFMFYQHFTILWRNNYF